MNIKEIEHIHSIQAIIDADRDKVRAGYAGLGKSENRHIPPPKSNIVLGVLSYVH